MNARPKPASVDTGTPLAGQKAINLALQGGGSHSAFTWGVLDRLLEDERLTFDGVTATSAGSFNAVLLADGLGVGRARGGEKAVEGLLGKDVRHGLLKHYCPLVPGQNGPKLWS